jgi:hypothetical protein
MQTDDDYIITLVLGQLETGCSAASFVGRTHDCTQRWTASSFDFGMETAYDQPFAEQLTVWNVADLLSSTLQPASSVNRLSPSNNPKR